MARGDSAPPKQSRRQQIVQTYRMARQADRWVGWVSLGVALLVLAVVLLVLGVLLNSWILAVLFGIPSALLAGIIVFGRRTEKAMYAQLEGKPGAAAAALGTLRRGWTVTPAVAITRNQDAVHRVVGRPGVVLIGEGAPQRVANLLAQEKKRHARVAGDMPVHDLIVGDGEGQVGLRQLSKRVMKLPRALRPAQVAELNYRLKALNVSPVAMPKGPLPRNVKLPKMPNQR